MIARIYTAKVMGPFIAISMLGMTAIGADARSLDEILDSKTLKVGVIPYDVDIIKDPNSGEYKGVFVEAIRFVCAEMKVECQFQEYTWQSFVGGIQAGQIDLSIATTYATIPRATGGAVAHAEDNWKSIRIGDVPFGVVKPCTRCVFTTVDPQRGTFDPDGEPLRTLTGYRRTPIGVTFGQNLIPRGRGQIRLGDPVEVLA
jgi:ABC-type amino acid transport substrate-binding protein